MWEEQFIWTDEMKAAAMKDAASVVDLYENLQRLTSVCKLLIEDTEDPGTEALAAVYCAERCLEKRGPRAAQSLALETD